MEEKLIMCESLTEDALELLCLGECYFAWTLNHFSILFTRSKKQNEVFVTIFVLWHEKGYYIIMIIIKNEI